MNSNDINSVVNNLCDKLGTTANKLIPEMAGYQIAKDSIWLVISLLFIGVCIGLTIKLLRMHKNDGEVLALYPERFKELDKQVQELQKNDPDFPKRLTDDWKRAFYNLANVTTVYNVDESTYTMLIVLDIFSGLSGVIIFGVALMKIIGWSLSPHAMAFMWIINQLGGGQ